MTENQRTWVDMENQLLKQRWQWYDKASSIENLDILTGHKVEWLVDWDLTMLSTQKKLSFKCSI